MAYVAISQDLINRVKNRIAGMKKAEINAELPDLERTYAIDASHLFVLGCWGKEHMHLVDQIPKDWLAKEDANYVNIVGHADIEGENMEISKSINFSGMTAAYRRPSTDYWNRSQSTLGIQQLWNMPPTPGRDEAIQRWNDGVTEKGINVRWNKIEKEIVGFLEKCKSLNEAVKLFPNVKLYLHNDDVQRMERKIHRGPRQELVASIDLEAMTAAAVVAQMTGGV